MKSEVRRIGQQLFAALSEKGLAMLVNHGIADEKVGNLTCIAHKMKTDRFVLNKMQCVSTISSLEK